MTQETTHTQSYTGQCHCGAIQYTAQIDLSKGTTRCNCTWCTKSRYWGVIISPADFELIQGHAQRKDFSKNPEIGTRYACTECGVSVYGQGHLEEIGGDFCSLNVATLNLSPEAFNELSISYLDGLNDNWWAAPAVTGYL